MRRFLPLFPLLGILLLPLPLAGQPRADEARPTGTWERVSPKGTVTIRIEADRLQLVAKGPDEAATIDADYSITKDCVLFGIVYGVNSGESEVSDKLLDQPFSFRYRIDDNVLTIKDVRGFGDTNLSLVGRYTRVDKKTAAAKLPADDVKRYYATPITPSTEPAAPPSVGVKESRSKN